MSEPARVAAALDHEAREPGAGLVPRTVTARAETRRRLPAAFAPRFFLALLLGLVWLGPAWWDHRFAYAMLAWDALALFAWLADFARLPKPAALQVSRIWLAPVSFGVEGSVALEVRNSSAVLLRAVLAEEFPPELAPAPSSASALALPAPPRLELVVPAFSSGRASYAFRPSRRGDTAVGTVYLRYQSVLKLAERWAVAELKQSLRVYPNLEGPKRQTLFLIRSRQIEMERRLKRQPGIGREFEGLRDYRPGDERRDICWTATARRGKPIVKIYQAERSQAVFLVLDAGRLLLAPVAAPAGSATKLDCAVDAALVLGHVAVHSGDRIGLLAYGRRPQARLRPGRGATHLRALLDRLAVVRGELVEADHARAAEMLLRLQSQRCLVVWLTDLAETAATPEVIEAAAGLATRHLVLFVAIGQPQLREVIARRPASVEEMYRYVAAQEMAHRRDLLLRRLREQGALVLDLEPGRLSTALVNQYLQVKERGLL